MLYPITGPQLPSADRAAVATPKAGTGEKFNPKKAELVMTINFRSEGQRSRHEAARKAKDDRRRLAELLARHEVALENMIGEIRTALSGLDEDGYIRGYVRLRLGTDDDGSVDEK